MVHLTDYRWWWWVAAAVADVVLAVVYAVQGHPWWALAGFVVAAGCVWAAVDEWRDRWVK